MNKFESPVVTASDVASRTTWGGAGTGLIAGLMQVDWAMWIGIIVAVVGLFVNIFFKIREDRRAAERHRLEIKRMEERCGK